MKTYMITCADGVPVELGFECPATIRLLQQIKRYHGMDAPHVLSEIANNFTAHGLGEAVEADQIFNLVMAFWAGYQAAELRERVH